MKSNKYGQVCRDIDRICRTTFLVSIPLVFRCDDWWTHIVLETFSRRDWIDNFRMSRQTFHYLCDQLEPALRHSDTRLRRAISVERHVAVTLWCLATFKVQNYQSPIWNWPINCMCDCAGNLSCNQSTPSFKVHSFPIW